jgi:predicted TIM-barrel fold metal-dependent hydrolase
MGVARGVLVQPSVYGFDNRCLLDALDAAGGRLVGVAVPSPDATRADLEAMHRRGVRAVRCNTLNPGGLGPEFVVGWAPLLADLGWHVELHVDLAPVADLAAFVERQGVPVVFDHMGRPAPGRARPDDPIERRLLALAREGACWVKLSGAYRLTSAPAPWSDVAPLAHAFLAAAPAACVWATDWPHVDTPAPVHPAELTATLDAWCPDPGARRALLVDNPTRLYAGS